jgi:hypothetical protein
MKGTGGCDRREERQSKLRANGRILLTPKVRAMVAYVASRLISGTDSSFIFDFPGPGHRSMGGTVNEKCINVYDYSENCQLTGSSSAGVFHLFHHGERVHISLEVSGQSFRGRDLGAGRQFSGTVIGPKTSIFDQADLRRYSYWCESPMCSRLPDSETGDAEDGLDSQAQESATENPGS